MAYEPKANSGTLWPNDRKKSENHPDVRGDIYLDRDLLKALMMKHPEGLVKVSIAGWKKEFNGKKALSISASEPYEKPAQEDDLPY
tara:strand:+ start:210 stop:467 length:258 start_codon:yes stop_codon:yes gene_type:complete